LERYRSEILKVKNNTQNLKLQCCEAIDQSIFSILQQPFFRAACSVKKVYIEGLANFKVAMGFSKELNFHRHLYIG